MFIDERKLKKTGNLKWNLKTGNLFNLVSNSLENSEKLMKTLENGENSGNLTKT